MRLFAPQNGPYSAIRVQTGRRTIPILRVDGKVRDGKVFLEVFGRSGIAMLIALEPDFAVDLAANIGELASQAKEK